MDQTGNSGISGNTESGQFARMLPGDHAFVAYARETDRRNVLRAYLRGGLQTSQRVAYLSGERPEAVEDWLCGSDPLLRRGVASGQLQLLAAGGLAPGHTAVDPDRTLHGLQVMADEAITDGYPALRLAADGEYLIQGLEPERAGPFERDLTLLVEANRMLALCLYPAALLPAQLAACIAEGHAPAAGPARAYERDGLRITLTSSPPGLRLAGELDRRHLPAFTQRLAELVESSGSIRLDMRCLTFIDVAAVTAIAHTAKGLDEGRQVVLDSPPSMAGRILAKCWQGIPLPRLAVAAATRPRSAAGTTWTAYAAEQRA